MSISEEDQSISTPKQGARRPRLGFAGVGWIGLKRLESIVKSDLADIVSICDSDAEKAATAKKLIPSTQIVNSFGELIKMDLDGIVIATPNAFHTTQTIAALQKGMAVFCQKPLARTAEETSLIVDMACVCDRFLGVDLSYRHLTGVKKIRALLSSQSCGHIFAAQLTFHNAYGPDKPWFYDLKLAGGGCLLDLGIHLVDLALWSLGFPKVSQVNSQIFSKGELLRPPVCQLEDFVSAQLTLDTGAIIQIDCSWNLNAGCDAIISGNFYGTRGGVQFHNVNGSFTEFQANSFQKTKNEEIASPPDDWQGRAAVEWVRKLAQNPHFDPESYHFVTVAETLDRIYGR